MEHKILKRAAKYSKEHRKRLRWYKVLGGLAAVVVFCTTYALILPAITMEHKPTCGMEEHTHDESCYTTILACGLAETEGHTHDSSCYTVETVTSTKLVCDNTDEDHVHDDSCYETVETEVETLTCGLEETPAHWHTADCYEQVLTCDLPEHTHDDLLCYGTQEDLAEAPSVSGSDEDENAADAEDEQGEEDAEGEDGEEDSEDAEGEEGEENAEDAEGEEGEEDEAEEEDEGDSILYVDETYTYEENELLKVVFHVKGEVDLRDYYDEDEYKDEYENAYEAEAGYEDEYEAAEEETTGGDQQEAELPVWKLPPEEQPELLFTVEEHEAGDEQYDAYAEAVAKDSEDSEEAEESQLMVMSYRLTYGDQELDLSQCEVTAEVMPSELLLELLAEPVQTFDAEEGAEDVENVMLLTAFEADQTGFVSELDSIYISESSLTMDDGIMTVELEEEESDGPINLIEAVMSKVDHVPQQRAFLTMTLNSETNTLAVRTEKPANPKFTVQYYANLEVVAYNDPALRKVIGSTSYTNELPVIDTTGGKLPANGGGSTASPNGNEIRNLYVDMTSGKLQTKTELTEVYSPRDLEYYKAPTINYMNALVENTNYELKEIWILKEGKEANSTDKDDWDIHTYSSDLHFTNRVVSAESGEYVLISDGATIRFVYDTTDNDNEFEAAFYDYDIGDGLIYSTQLNAQKQTGGKPTSTQGSGTYHMHTNQSGINSPGNYTGSGAKLAFGNANTGSGLQHELWGGNLLNKANQTQSGHPSVTGSYKGCTFGLVTGLVDGKVQYAGNVNAPNLFNDGSAAGKTSYDNGEFSLTFNRVGDTYTLTTVNGTGTGDLDTFNHPSPNASTVHNHIWTNNFWPMDSAASFGTDGHDMKFGDYTNRENYKFAGQAGSSGGSAAANGTFPWSDDGEDHNSYFGMHYLVEFDLVEDYVGPLEYYFFGDDDMWVFLDGKLVCDIGGVHSSVGEYVNLWDYLEKGSEESAGKHTLSFFYTERGESGSTCWMQFTLPSVSSLTPETSDKDYGQLKVEKAVAGSCAPSDGTYSFKIHLTDERGNNLPDDYAYFKYDGDGNIIGNDLIIFDGGEFTLKNDEYIIIQYIPQGTKFTLEELGVPVNCDVSVEPGESEDPKTSLVIDESNPGKAEGEIPEGGTAWVKYINDFPYKLPETGGPGVYWWYILGSTLAAAAAATLVYKKLYRRGGRD